MDILCQQKICEFENCEMINLPEETINIINRLVKKVGAPTYNKTPNFSKKKKNNNLNWAHMRNFKVTKIQKSELDETLTLLNKLSKKTYTEIRDDIIKNIDLDPEKSNEIVKYIFKISSANSFYSEIYTKLFNDLIAKFHFIKNICNDQFKEYFDFFENIRYVEYEEDYNLYCEINKENDKRRAIGKFFSNLLKYDIIELKEMYILINKLIYKIFQNMGEDTSKKIIEEISENLKIIIIHSNENLKKDSSKYEELMEKLNIIVNSKHENGISNKTLFKFMDVLDSI